MVRKHPRSSVLRGTGEDADAGTWENTEPEQKGSLSSSWRLSRKMGIFAGQAPGLSLLLHSVLQSAVTACSG